MSVGEDPLLRALGQAAAAEERLTPDEELLARWGAGTLGDEERRALEARAAAEPELARALAAHRPLTDDARAKLVDRLLAERRADDAAETRGARRSLSSVANEGGRRAPTPGPSLRARARRWGIASVTLALAAGLLLWVGTKRRTETAPSPEHALAALPAYELDAAGGDQDTRGAATVPASAGVVPKALGPTSRLTLTVRPATAVNGEVVVEAFVRAKEDPGVAGTLVALPWRFAISPTGTAHLSALAGELLGERRGPWEVRVLVARATASADERRAWAASNATAGPGWQRFALDVRLVDAR